MHLVFNDDANVAAWVAARIPHMNGEAFPPSTAIGVVDEDGQALGGVVFTNHYPAFGSIEASFASASPRWLTKSLITAILSYPFAQLDCQRVTTITPLKATSARVFLEVFGFKREGVIRRGFGSDDAVISGLLRKEWDRSPFNLRRVSTSGLQEHLSRSRQIRQHWKRGPRSSSPGAAAREALERSPE